MPWKSKSQRRLFYAKPELHRYIDEYQKATGKKKLPEHVSKKKSIKRKSNKK